MREHDKQTGPEKHHQSKAEELKGLVEKRDHDKKPEHEKSAEHSHVDKEKSIEKARQSLKDKLERESDNQAEKAKSKTEKSHESMADRPVSRREKNQIYTQTMKTIRHQLSPAEQSFSKLIHAKPVEVVSEVLEDTIFSNSFVWGGVIGAVLLGGIVYLAAISIGFQLSGGEFTLGLIIGGFIGLALKLILKQFRKKN